MKLWSPSVDGSEVQRGTKKDKTTIYLNFLTAVTNVCVILAIWLHGCEFFDHPNSNYMIIKLAYRMSLFSVS